MQCEIKGRVENYNYVNVYMAVAVAVAVAVDKIQCVSFFSKYNLNFKCEFIYSLFKKIKYDTFYFYLYLYLY